MRLVVVGVSLLLFGCSSSQWGDKGGSLCDSEMLTIGPDTYMAGGKFGNGCGATYKVKHAAVFCQRLGKEVLVTNIDDTSPSQVIFKCLPPHDKDLKRPVYDSYGTSMENQ